MPWMGVGVYLPLSAPAGGRAAFAGFADFVGFFAAVLRAAAFVVFARFFMPRTLQRTSASVNAPAAAAARP
jgi:hypothetical protein